MVIPLGDCVNAELLTSHLRCKHFLLEFRDQIELKSAIFTATLVLEFAAVSMILQVIVPVPGPWNFRPAAGRGYKCK